MTELTRRDALAAGALATLATSLPAWAQNAAQAAGAAAWDLTEIYPNDAAWDAARKKALAALPGLAKYKGRLGESADDARRALIAPVRSRQDDRPGLHLCQPEGDEDDLRVAAKQEKQAQAIDLYTAFGEATSWVAPEFLTIGKAKIDGFVAANADAQEALRFLSRRHRCARPSTR